MRLTSKQIDQRIQAVRDDAFVRFVYGKKR